MGFFLKYLYALQFIYECTHFHIPSPYRKRTELYLHSGRKSTAFDVHLRSVVDKNNTIHLVGGTNNMWSEVILLKERTEALLYLTHNSRTGFCSLLISFTVDINSVTIPKISIHIVHAVKQQGDNRKFGPITEHVN